MNFQSIPYFLTLARERNFTRAAEKLHITQQTLSANMAALEREWGAAFFLRRSPLELTEAGEAFYAYARRAAEEEETLRRTLSDLERGDAGTLRLGMGFARERKLIPRLIAGFRRLHPKVSFHVRGASNEGLAKLLRAGELDLAIARFDGDPPGLTTRPLYGEHIALLVSRELLRSCSGAGDEDINRFAASGLRDMELLRHCPFLLTSAHNVAGAVAARFLERAPFPPVVAAESDNMESLVDMAFLSVGAVFCPANLTGHAGEEASCGMLRIDLPETAYPISFGWRTKSAPWSVREAFMEYVEMALGEEAADDLSAGLKGTG